MRDLLEFDEAGDGRFLSAEYDPVKRAAAHARRDLPKRFYSEVSVEARPEGHVVLLDGRAVKTPAKAVLAFPTAPLAEAVAAEWRAVGEWIDPARMPLTRLSNSVIDGVTKSMAEVAADIVKYAGTDLVCYRAEHPERLVERQAAAWDPLLDWMDEVHGARFLVAEGIVPVTQDADAIAAVARLVDGLDAFRLGALHSLTTLTGSVIVALAHLKGRLDADAAWTAAHVDDDWNLEVWGRDDEALARLAVRRRDFDAAVLVLATV